MKRIMLAPRGKRFLASLIDGLILLISTTLTYFLGVMPFTYDVDEIHKNTEELIELYKGCDLFYVDKDGNQTAINDFDEIKGYDQLFDTNVKIDDTTFIKVSVLGSLYSYYHNQHASYAGDFNYKLEAFKSEILQVGSKDSNIADFNPETNSLILIDEKLKDVTFQFVDYKFSETISLVKTTGRIKEINEINDDIAYKSLALIVPVFFGFSLIFNLIIPLCSPFGQTIGKHIFHLILLDKDGYHLNKWWLIPRWLVYSVVEYLGGILTFGATFLISYTMFMFNKKRRCLHDYAGNSVVVDRRDSIFFRSREEERYFEERLSAQKAIEQDAQKDS